MIEAKASLVWEIQPVRLSTACLLKLLGVESDEIQLNCNKREPHSVHSDAFCKETIGYGLNYLQKS